MVRVLRTRVVVLIGLAVAASVLGCQTSARATAAGFWYERGPFPMPTTPAKFSSPLSDHEIETIEQTSRAELARAFAGLRIVVTDRRNAFWRVAVLPAIPRRMPHPLPNSGESLTLGPLGGYGAVAFDVVALEATLYAPTDASRQNLVEAIGRGVGRVAAHEFAHQILGVTMMHDAADKDSYEYPSPDRASQYYGQLHWAKAWPLLLRKLGP